MLILFLLQVLFAPTVFSNPPEDEDAVRRYYQVAIADMKTTRWTHVIVEGRVANVYIAGDGDLHIRLEDPVTKARITCEGIPGLKVTRPRRNQMVRIYGISRIDPYHKWPEVHPIERLEILK